MKILVDKLPENKYDCPFYYSDDDIGGVYGSRCILGDGDYCSLGSWQPYRCEYLKTFEEMLREAESIDSEGLPEKE